MSGADRQAGAMSAETPLPRKKLPILKLAIVGVVVAVTGAVALREIGVARLVELFDQFVFASAVPLPVTVEGPAMLNVPASAE